MRLHRRSFCAAVAIVLAACSTSSPSEPNTADDDWLLGRWSGSGTGYSQSPLTLEIVVSRGERTTPGLSGPVTERGLLVTGVLHDVKNNDSISFQTLALHRPQPSERFTVSFITRGLKAFPNLTGRPNECPDASYQFDDSFSAGTEHGSNAVLSFYISGRCPGWDGPNSQFISFDGGQMVLRRS